MVCPPVRSIIHSLKLVDYLRTGGQTMLYLSRRKAMKQGNESGGSAVPTGTKQNNYIGNSIVHGRLITKTKTRIVLPES